MGPTSDLLLGSSARLSVLAIGCTFNHDLHHHLDFDPSFQMGRLVMTLTLESPHLLSTHERNQA